MWREGGYYVNWCSALRRKFLNRARSIFEASLEVNSSIEIGWNCLSWNSHTVAIRQLLFCWIQHLLKWINCSKRSGFIFLTIRFFWNFTTIYMWTIVNTLHSTIQRQRQYHDVNNISIDSPITPCIRIIYKAMLRLLSSIEASQCNTPYLRIILWSRAAWNNKTDNTRSKFIDFQLGGAKFYTLNLQCTRIEPSFSCYNVIAINNLPLLHRSEASLHLSCGQMLRRDQVSAHADTVHNRIMAGRKGNGCIVNFN